MESLITGAFRKLFMREIIKKNARGNIVLKNNVALIISLHFIENNCDEISHCANVFVVAHLTDRFQSNDWQS